MALYNMVPAALLAATVTISYALYRRFTAPKPSAPLPPGPKPVPILGNVANLTPKELWLSAEQWAKQYGVFRSQCGAPVLTFSTRSHHIPPCRRPGTRFSEHPRSGARADG